MASKTIDGVAANTSICLPIAWEALASDFLLTRLLLLVSQLAQSPLKKEKADSRTENMRATVVNLLSLPPALCAPALVVAAPTVAGVLLVVVEGGAARSLLLVLACTLALTAAAAFAALA